MPLLELAPQREEGLANWQAIEKAVEESIVPLSRKQRGGIAFRADDCLVPPWP